jgi:rod shape determining protein RodA
MLIDRRIIRYFDWQLFGVAAVIALFGLVVLYSAGYDPDASVGALSWLPFSIQSMACAKQVLFLAVGLVVMIIGMSLPLQRLYQAAYILYFICLILLVLVLVKGSVSHGARRWLSLGPLTFQPSEIMKMVLILTMAHFLARNMPPSGGYRLKNLLAPFAIFGIPMALIMKQPDLGTALSLGAVGFSMVLFVGIRWKTLAMMFLAGLIAVYPAWRHLQPYQQKRIFALISPEDDPLGSGYHIIQSKIAVGSGGFSGKGFLKGTQSQLEFLPEHTTDFVFSVLAEEWGFVGCIPVLCLYLYLMYRLLRVVQRGRGVFSSLVVFGIGCLFFFNTVINIGMVIGLFPVVGIPLPLFSYGGTSVLSSMFALGIVLGISTRRHGLVHGQ